MSKDGPVADPNVSAEAGLSAKNSSKSIFRLYTDKIVTFLFKGTYDGLPMVGPHIAVDEGPFVILHFENKIQHRNSIHRISFNSYIKVANQQRGLLIVKERFFAALAAAGIDPKQSLIS